MISWHANLISRSAKLFMRCTIKGVFFSPESAPVHRLLVNRDFGMSSTNHGEPSASITDSSRILQEMIWMLHRRKPMEGIT